MTDIVELSQTVAVVLAGGQGTRLHELTQRESKPALPFTRFYRIVDFAMANLVRSGVGRVIVASQYRPDTLMDHVCATWGPSLPGQRLMMRNGADVVPAGGYRGTADALRANAALLDDMNAREVLIVAADHIYSMDFEALVTAHRTGGQSITVAAMPVPKAEASRFGILTTGPQGQIEAFAEKPAHPATIPGDPDQSLASLGIYVADWPWLKNVLQDPAVMDFGQDVIPLAVGRRQATAWHWSGYWRDVGTLDSLRESWLEFESGTPPCQRPIVPGMGVSAPMAWPMQDRFHARENLGGLRLMSPLVGNADTRRWVTLDRSILMPGAQISPSVRLTNVIVASGAVVPDGMRVGEDPDEDGRWFRISGDTILVTSAMLARRAALRRSTDSRFTGRLGPFLSVRTS